MTLGGFLAIRNADRLDYCWREAANSLLPICDEVVIADCDSDDGTRQAIEEWASREPKIKLALFPWTNPVRTNKWWPDFLNFARRQLTTDWAMGLDADELVHEACYHEILEAVRLKRSLICHRYNFWKDTEHLIPHGKCCGHEVIRVAPANLFMCSDYPDPRANELMRIAQPSGVTIFHYGFLRHPKAFFLKAREVQRIWAGEFDKRLEQAESDTGPWMEKPYVTEWVNDIIPFRGSHPKLAFDWLRARGYNPQ